MHGMFIAQRNQTQLRNAFASAMNQPKLNSHAIYAMRADVVRSLHVIQGYSQTHLRLIFNRSPEEIRKLLARGIRRHRERVRALFPPAFYRQLQNLQINETPPDHLPQAQVGRRRSRR